MCRSSGVEVGFALSSFRSRRIAILPAAVVLARECRGRCADDLVLDSATENKINAVQPAPDLKVKAR
jgi:hypothetical protein